MKYEEALEIITNAIQMSEMTAVQDKALALTQKATMRQIPQKPIWKDTDFGDKTLSCPHCSNPVTNYWVKGKNPAHCQFCGQALDWSEAE